MALFTRPSDPSVMGIVKKSRWNSTTAILTAALCLSLGILYYFTPWPSVLSYRYRYNRAALAADRVLAPLVPGNLIAIRNVQYNIRDEDAIMDLFLPPQVPVGKRLPLILWIHGGDFIAGSRLQTGNYCRLMAAKGYVVATIDYTLAPERPFPYALFQVNAALDFLVKNADRFSINANRIFVGGNDAGAQLAAQTANITVNAKYASLLKIKPVLQPGQLSGCILYNGIYAFTPQLFRDSEEKHLRAAICSYSANYTVKNELFRTASVVNYITAAFPSCYIAANNRERSINQSEILEKKLREVKVEFTSCILHDGIESNRQDFAICNPALPQGQKTFSGALSFIGMNLP